MQLPGLPETCIPQRDCSIPRLNRKAESADETPLSQRSAGLAMFAGVWQAGGMKKQSSDQAFHDRRYQERKRAEAERKVPKKKVAKPGGESR